MAEIARMLVLSTGHLTQDTCNVWLHEHGSRRVGAYHKANTFGEFGWFIWVPPVDMQAEDGPADLLACIALAQAEECGWIMFDQDGEATDDLPYYDW